MSDAAARERVIRARIGDIGLDAFPDDTAVAWEAVDIRHAGDYAFVESVATPATVGYPRFRFVLRFEPGGVPVLAAGYAWMSEGWGLLFTTPDEPEDWRALA